MSKCPICYTEYTEGAIATCSVCHWDLKPCLLPKTGKSRKAYLEKEAVYLQWAREMWLKYLAQNHSSVNPSVHLIPWPNHSNPSQNSNHHLDESLISQLASRLSSLESRCQQSEAKITELISELADEVKYRSQMESQMEWVLYVLQEANPQEIQQTLWQLQEWANSVANSQPQNSAHHYLQSEVGIDYSKLEKLLAAGKWRQADQRTWEIMLRIGNQEDQGFLSPENIETLPRTDLMTISGLWEHYSGGIFGFCVQQKIWQNVSEDYTDFCDRVGWRVKDNWLYYEDLNCSLEAKPGHLPVIVWRKRACYGMGGATAQESFSALILRFTEC